MQFMKLKKRHAHKAKNQTQRALHLAAENCLGTFAGGNPHRAETARKTIRRRLQSKERRLGG
jgi:hypothetical protein